MYCRDLEAMSSIPDRVELGVRKSLMAEWLEQAIKASQWHGMYCHDLEVMSSNPDQGELGVRSTSVLSRTWTKNKNCYETALQEDADKSPVQPHTLMIYLMFSDESVSSTVGVDVGNTSPIFR